MLADQYVEHEAVDLVVDTVIGHDADDRGGLAVAVDAALALFVAGGVPRQVVVNDRVEVLLQVDALAQTVGADQNTLGGFRQLDARAPRARRAEECP